MVVVGAVEFVRLKFAAAAAPEVVAATVYGPPAVALAVNVDEVARPLAFVVSVSVAVPLPNLPLAPEEGAVNVTETPLAGFPLEVTNATSGFANAVLTFSLWPDPLDTAITGIGAAVFVRLNFAAAPVSPVKSAVTVYGPPVVPFAVKADAVATPLVPVESVSVVFPLVANVPLAPVAGAVNVTITPLTGLLSLSTTVACRDVPKAVETAPLCVPPLVALIPAGVPAEFDRLKVAGVVAPVAEAETL